MKFLYFVKWHISLIVFGACGFAMLGMASIAEEYAVEKVQWTGECSFTGISDKSSSTNIKFTYMCNEQKITPEMSNDDITQLSKDINKPIVCKQIYNDWLEHSYYSCNFQK